MNIDKISFTGADNRTDIKDLVQLQGQYPRIEWAILYFPERDGLARNPTLEWREQFYREKLQSAMHLCGSGVNQFAEGNSKLINEIEQFGRIQINLKPRWASQELVESLIKRCEDFSHIQFITQYNSDNMVYMPLWQQVKNHAWLFDASLGKGVSPHAWPQPIAHKDCGYAGGLSPQNIDYELPRIRSVAQHSTQKIWIDMESGVRTNDQFDLDKVKVVLEAL